MTLERDALLGSVRVACDAADAPALARLLHPSVVALVDGGGDVIAETLPVTGRSAVVAELLRVLDGATLSAQPVNGVAGLIARRGRRVTAIIAIDVGHDLVTRVWITLNPLKLLRWNT